ncbi:MAG: PEP-CTERM sorting domain-containing protein [Candidatus Schekmanbacteria bacterium]|nr:PEP-CTERM sorting domain-containing protein [Candidatus Schekmanbacteria bacterium]
MVDRKPLAVVVLLVALSTFLLIFPQYLQANPSDSFVSLKTQSDWQNALADGRIASVTTYYDALGAHYGVIGEDFIQVPPELLAAGSESGLGDGLLMYWGNSESELSQVATWQYTFPEDPNLIGSLISTTVIAPAGVQSVSLTINDGLGGWISWDWNVGGAGPVTPGVPYNVVINPAVFAPQSGSTSFAFAGFNPAIAVSLQADELAVGFNNWNNFPPVPIIGGIKPWNYWTSLTVAPPVPEPSTMMLLGAGLLGLLAIGRRKIK